MRMDQILSGLSGILAVHDDVTVYGKDDDDHNAAMSALMQRAEEKGLVFNSSKCFIRQPKIKFFGRTFSADRISPDPAKI